MLKSTGFAFAGLTLALASPVAAAPIEYALSGSFSQEGSAEVVVATLLGQGDTVNAFETIVDGQTASVIPLSSISLTIGGITADLPFSATFFTFPALGAGSFAIGDAGQIGGITFAADELVGFGGVSALGPISVAFIDGFNGLGGTQVPVTATDLSFVSQLVAIAVPEPSTWLMMIAGFGLVGAATRRQRATVRFA